MPPGATELDLPGIRRRLLLALLPLSTGAAVLVTITLVHDSLLWPTAILLAGTGATAWAAVRTLPTHQRTLLAQRIRIGLVAGVWATIAYDLVRYVLVAALSWSVSPFGAFPLFGRLLIGGDQPEVALWVAGTVFHLLNGLGFAIGYTLVITAPTVWTAVIWGMTLELFTILLYPDWLGIRAIDEFFSMSMLGHLAYGIVLGLIAVRAARSSRAGST
jgi:hypothetical protein